MTLDWMWIGKFFRGRNVCVRKEKKNMEKYCTWCYVMENG